MEQHNILDQQHEELSDAKMIAQLRAQYDDLNSADVVNFKDIGAISREIDRVKKRLAKTARDEASNDTGPTREEAKVATDEIKSAMRQELKRRNYHYVTAHEKFWLKTEKNNWIPVSEKGLMRDIDGASQALGREILYDVMKEDDRWKDRATFSFDAVDDDTLNMLVRDFVALEDGEAHWFFDMLIRAIGGEREENYRHIEKLVLSKYLHPESVTIPALLLQDRGGTGKNLMAARLLPAIFGDHGVSSNLRVEHVVGKFNAVGEGKAVWFLNEASRGGYSHAGLKALVGSETYAIEHKGVNPIIGPMTAWIIMATQDDDGAVLLEGGGADRRWSVVKGGRELALIVAEHLSIDKDAAKAWIDTTGKHILSNRKEAGKWLRSLVERHGDQSVSMGLHGADYQAMRHIQRPIERLVMEAVFESDEFENIRTSTLYEAYEHFAKGSTRTPMGRGKFHELVSQYIADHHPDWIGKVAANIKVRDRRTKMEFYSIDKIDGSSQLTDEYYFSADEYGRKRWFFTIG
jgi:hypothetical protein